MSQYLSLLLVYCMYFYWECYINNIWNQNQVYVYINRICNVRLRVGDIYMSA